MPEFDDRLRRDLRRLAEPADPAGAFERVLERKIRRRIMRQIQVVALVVAVVAGTGAGTFALTRVFQARPLPRPASGPTPESGRIVFLRGRDRLAPAIYTMNPEGGDVAKVTRYPFPPHLAGVLWSPDGTKIAISIGISEGRGELDVSAVDGSGRRRVSDFGDPQDPAWSPDGTRIAFSAYVAKPLQSNRIFVIDVNGGDPVKLTNPPNDCADSIAAWSPDGSQIFFVRDCMDSKGFEDLYNMNPQGGSLRRLRRLRDVSIRSILGASWSPDGTRIAMTINTDGGVQVFTIKADGSNLTQLTRVGDNNGGNVWSPDSKKIAFASTRDGNSHVYVMNADGGDERKLTNGSANDSVLAWQPVPGPPSPSPRPSGLPGPRLPSPAPSPPRLGPGCDASSVLGDFNGDFALDVVTVARTRCLPPEGQPSGTGAPPWSIDIRWGPATAGGRPATGTGPIEVPAPDCHTFCRAFGPADLDKNGTDEFLLVVDEGASTQFLEVWELNEAECCSNAILPVSPPGAPGYPPNQPIRLPYGGSVTHQDSITCDTGTDGSHLVIATSALLSPVQSTWHIHETTFAFDGKAFAVVSTRDLTAPFDPAKPTPPPPSGRVCVMPQTR